MDMNNSNPDFNKTFVKILNHLANLKFLARIYISFLPVKTITVLRLVMCVLKLLL